MVKVKFARNEPREKRFAKAGHHFVAKSAHKIQARRSGKRQHKRYGA